MSTIHGMSEDLVDLLLKNIERQVADINIRTERIIECIIRNHITPPIKGKITKNKLKWRGINSIVFDCNHEFVGVQQRNECIDINGKRKKL